MPPTALLWLQDPSGASSMPTPVVVAIVGFLTAALGVLGTLQYVRTRPTSTGTDALLERAEGAWQEKVSFMLKGLGDTISAGHNAHRDELHEISRTMRDQTQALRLAVDEMVAQRKDFAAYSVRGIATMAKVEDIHQRLLAIPWSPPKRKIPARRRRRAS